MSHSTPEPLRFPPVAGVTVRAEFGGGAMSSDIGPLIFRGVDQQIGLIDRLVQAVDNRRHPSYIEHPLHDPGVVTNHLATGTAPAWIAPHHSPLLES